MKNRMALYAGIALIAGLYAYDQSTKIETTLPATLTGIDNQASEKGSDIWHMSVMIDKGEIALEPRASRPDVAVGDRICVTETVREGQLSQYHWAPSTTC